MKLPLALAAPAAALAVVSAGLTVGVLIGPSTGVASPTPTVTATIACQEDDPCWDCAAMGNHICSGTELSDEDRAKGWEAWDKSAGWTRLPATSTDVKVSLVGVAPALYPKLADGQVTVVGTDSKWYVFTSDTVVTE